MEYKRNKKLFISRLRHLSVDYENEEIVQAVKLAELNRNAFWRLLKKARNSGGVESASIRNREERVVYEIDEVLDVWKSHFSGLGTPSMDPNFDDEHFARVCDLIMMVPTQMFSWLNPLVYRRWKVPLDLLTKGKLAVMT